ncbi:MAG TPA: uracil-DNA glycosylase [Thermoplasmata archaeon]|nr:uracil-DNA glycosylase [Thermoplasmata archaeon]
MAWHALSRSIENCRRCPLHATRQHVVIYRGGPRPKVLFVGEAPGAEEDAVGIPFVGRSGRRLDDGISSLGLHDGEFGVLNLIKCRPPGNRFDRASAAACRPFLDRQVALLAPEVIVTLGAHALAQFDPSSPPVTIAAGRPRRSNGTLLFPLLHPAAALHAPKYRTRWADDLGRLRALLEARAAHR